ncbi:MAG: hypothetical protein HZC16_00160 [Candidatus Omnitrophica bacterium]|nr:hypothetical protein [Candidatus Omnitrophota bacterium]
MQKTNKTTLFANVSLWSITLAVLLASVTHAYEFGYRAFMAGFILIALLSILNILYRSTRSKAFLVLYGLLNAWVVIGFGLFNGFWNHAFKVFLNYLHNGFLPSFLAKLFMTPQTGSFFFEGVGILTFVISIFAAYYGYKFIKEG